MILEAYLSSFVVLSYDLFNYDTYNIIFNLVFILFIKINLKFKQEIISFLTIIIIIYNLNQENILKIILEFIRLSHTYSLLFYKKHDITQPLKKYYWGVSGPDGELSNYIKNIKKLNKEDSGILINSNINSNNKTKRFECNICLKKIEDNSKVYNLKCNHIMHEECLLKIKTVNNKTNHIIIKYVCTLCQTKI
jgi:hypothetical protein